MVLYTAKWLIAEPARLLHTLSTEEATAIVDGLIDGRSRGETDDGKKRVVRTGITWKQQTLVLMLPKRATSPRRT